MLPIKVGVKQLIESRLYDCQKLKSLNSFSFNWHSPLYTEINYKQFGTYLNDCRQKTNVIYFIISYSSNILIMSV